MSLRNAIGGAAGLALFVVVGIAVVESPPAPTPVVSADPSSGATGADAPTLPTLVATGSTAGQAADPADSAPTGVTTSGSNAPDPTATTAGSTVAGTVPTNTIGAGSATTVASPPRTTPPAPTLAPSAATSPTTAATDLHAVRVDVVNSSGKNGVATTTASRLTAAGWAPKVASTSWPAAPTTIVMYAAGKHDAAVAVAAALGLAADAAVAGTGQAQWATFVTDNFDILVLAAKDLR